MTPREPSIAVIGCGYWGKNIVRNFAQLGALRMVSDANAENARAMADQYRVPAASLDDIIADAGVQGVAIAVPAALHAELSARCLRAGKHVFVEKPVALVVNEAKQLVDLAQTHGKLLMVGHLLNYHPGFLKVCELTTQGAIGTLYRICANRLSFGKVRTEENVLWSFAPHDISMILRLAGGERPVLVDAHGGSYVSSGVEDFATVNLGFETGLTAQVFVSWLHPFKEHKLAVIGSEGAIVFDDTLPLDRKVSLHKYSVSNQEMQIKTVKSEAEFVSISDEEPLRNECLAFVSGIEDPALIYTNGQEGLRVLDVLDRAQMSMRNNKAGQ